KIGATKYVAPCCIFQQVPLNVIESNTELISYYRKKRDTDQDDLSLFSAGIKGLTSNSVDSWESLSEGAQLALAYMSNPMPNSIPQAESYFNELLQQNSKKSHSRVKRFSYEPTDRINAIFSDYEQLASDYGRKNCH
ncbi:hypothetical protein BpHYR1_007172, partial [Brachionus plicatilis]